MTKAQAIAQAFRGTARSTTPTPNPSNGASHAASVMPSPKGQTMSRRRKSRKASKSHNGLIIFGVILLIIAATIAQHITVFLAAGACLIAGYGVGRLHARSRAQSPATASARGKTASTAKTGQTARKGAPGDARARRNGWLPPITTHTVTKALSSECDEGACIICPGCDHGCGHDARIIARNMAATEPMPEQPDNQPFPF